MRPIRSGEHAFHSLTVVSIGDLESASCLPDLLAFQGTVMTSAIIFLLGVLVGGLIIAVFIEALIGLDDCGHDR